MKPSRSANRRSAHPSADRTEDTGSTVRRPLLAWAGIGVAALVLAGVFNWRTDAGRAWLDDVRTEDNIGGLHTTSKLAYKSQPPMGGPHNPTWQNCGVFDTPLSDAHVVHSLEHGAVWITYQPAALDAAQVALLADAAARNDFVIVSPYPEQPATISLTAWNHQLDVEDASDDRVAKFVAHFTRALSAPEPGAPCTGGADTTRDTDPTAAGPVMGPGVEAEKLIGMTESAAATYAGNQGWGYRVGRRDNEEYMLTTDYVASRVTVVIENGQVTAVQVG